MDRTNIFAAHDDKRVVGWFDHDKATWWDDHDYNNNGSRGPGRGAGVVRTSGGRWLGLLWTIWQGEERTHVYITDDEARDWLLANNEDEAVEKYFGELAEEEDRRPGRPAIGGEVLVRLGDLLPLIDQLADGEGVKRAEMIRQLVSAGLAAKVTDPV